MTKTELTKYEKALLQFYLKGIFSDLSKSLIFFLIFYALGFHKEFLCGILFLVLFRIYSGGIHCKTYLRCLILSFVILSSGILLGTYFYPRKIIKLLLSVICCTVTCYFTPITAPSRPKLSNKAVLILKIKEAVIISSFIFVLLFAKQNLYINIGFWILMLHTMQLVVAEKRR